ncbi:PD-(D/E)XK motif protein [Neomegalonema sp.]|uniref:PD-(D/E)XK motif protein n=1 Tax=Neomegalonema sp. TaxID=2039713 RepID=UPI0026189400|nr:PD-(D/E)XK motif protein [Neomegalonema sp.]MDD2868650.1 PD-(D/E)XK motif protein [Neomegalonema sp.]
MTGWTEEGLARAWRALARPEAGEAWRFVRLAEMGGISVEAGRRFPEGREALIVVFPGSRPLDPARLPEGGGFDVASLEDRAHFAGRTAVALVRRAEGPADIFAIIAVDILRTLEAAAGAAWRDVMDAFLDRVREWQDFMARTRRPLSPDEQTGLFGELWTLRLLTETPLGAAGALEAWRGPLRAAQDFHLGEGALEVKSALRTGAFLARISSVEQLDCARAPLFLCALRLAETLQGASLADLAEELRGRFAAAGLLRRFEALLMTAGYLDEHAPFYGRLLEIREARAFPVEGDMPRLVRAALPAALRSASYVLDLDALEAPALGLPQMLHAFGLDSHEP